MSGKKRATEEKEGYRITDQYTVGDICFAMGRRENDCAECFAVWQYQVAAPSELLDKRAYDNPGAAMQNYLGRIGGAVTARFRQTGEQPLHPPRCVAIEPSTGQLINIQRGIHGYFGSDWSRSDDLKYNRESADLLNERMRVTKAQEQAMLAGSMFGWDTKLADPRNYDEQGQLLKNKADRKKEQHER